MTKLAIGTSGFGNKLQNKPTLTQTDINNILDYAFMLDIDTIDTARAYGNSEQMLGQSNKMQNFKVVSKFVGGTNPLEGVLDESLRYLKMDKMYCYMYHRFADIKEYPKNYKELQELKEKGKIEKTGVSVYSPAELRALMDNKFRFDLVQLPYNVFDRRFEPMLEELKSLDTEIQARSVFLQGLVFKDPGDLPHNLYSLGIRLSLLKSSAEKIGISVAALCLCFVTQNKYIDKVIVGCDSLNDLTTSVANAKHENKVRDVINELKDLREDQVDLIDPAHWRK